MPLTLLPITQSHLTSHPTLLPRIAHIQITSFLTTAIYVAMYPDGYTTTLLDSTIARYRTSIESDPTVRFLTVIDGPVLAPDSANLIAFTKYHIYATADDQEARKDTAPRVWPDEMNRLVVDEFWGQILVVRRRWGPRLGAHIVVDLVATEPGSMRRGAGRLMMAEIGRVADETGEGLAAILESSPEGIRLYAGAGFMDTEDRTRVDLGRYIERKDRGVEWREAEGVRVGEEKGGKSEAWYENVVMLRPVKGRQIEHYLAGR
jgi:hypothetical protein